MSHVQLALEVSDDIRLAQTCRETLEEYLETKTVVVSL